MNTSANTTLSHTSNRRDLIVPVGGMLMVTTLAIIGLYWPTIRVLVPYWMNGESDFYGTVFLILPISLYLAWQRRDVLADPPRHRWIGVILVGALSVGWWIADIISIVTIQLLIVTMLLPAGVWAVSGYETFKRWLFPLGMLVFLIPLADFLVPLLQDWTAWSSVTLLQLTQIPVHLDGRVIVTPRRNWIVAEACSGVRWIMAAAMFGYLYAGMYLRTWPKRMAFMSVAVLLPIVTNGIRAYVVPLLDYLSTAWIAQGVDDFLAGWIFFGLIIIVLMWLGARWQVREDRGRASAAELHAEQSVATIRRETWTTRTAIVVITLALSAMGPLLVLVMNYASESVTLSPELIPRMVAASPWSESSEEQGLPWRPVFKGQSAEVLQTFSSQGRQVSLYIAFYPRQSQNVEAVSEGNSLYGKAWQSMGQGLVDLLVDGQRLSVPRLDIRQYRQDEGIKRVVVSWYWIDQTHTSSVSQAKLLQLRSWLPGHSPAAAGIVVSSSYRTNQAEAIEAVQDFLANHALHPFLVQVAAAHHNSIQKDQ